MPKEAPDLLDVYVSGDEAEPHEVHGGEGDCGDHSRGEQPLCPSIGAKGLRFLLLYLLQTALWKFRSGSHHDYVSIHVATANLLVVLLAV